jgi:acylphosphatase
MPDYTIVPPGGEEEGGGEGGKAKGGDASAGTSNGVSYLDKTTSATGITSAPGRYVRSLQVQDADRLINSRGDSREIKIIGTPGAGFNLEINDSSGCSILEESLNQIGIPKSGIYKLKQRFPDITTSAQGGLVNERYDIILTPNADSRHDASVDVNENSTEEEVQRFIEKIKNNPPPNYKIGEPSVTLYQYPDPTITITNSSTQTSPALSVSGADITKTSPAESSSGQNVTYTLTVAEDSVTSGYFYVNEGNFNKAITKSSTFTKVVSRPEGEGRTNDIVLKPGTTRTVDGVITSEVTPGMRVYGEVIKSKIVTKSLEVPSCKRATNKFSLSNTLGLFPGMVVRIPGLPVTELVSIDCAKNVTLERKVVIPEDSNIEFKYSTYTSVNKVINQINSRGETHIEVSAAVNAIDGMELSFDDDTSRVSGSFRFSGSGSKEVTLISEVNFSKFGRKDVEYAWNLDNVITRIPNAKDYNIEVPRSTASVRTYTIDVKSGDYDANSASKTTAITRQPSNGTASVISNNIAYVMAPGFRGSDEILFTRRDGANDSAEKRITITVK